MLQQINELFTQFTIYSKSNPIVAGVVGLWGLGVVTFLLKDVPQKIWHNIVSQSTTTLTLNSQDDSYYEFLTWLTKRNMHSFVRTLNINNGRQGSNAWHGNKSSRLSIGYGNMYFLFEGRPFKMTRAQQTTQNEYTKEIIQVTCLGRTHKAFMHIFEEIARKDKEDTTLMKIYTYREGWQLASKQTKRTLDTVALNKDLRSNLLTHVDKFLADKAFYQTAGIPYRTNILLEGPPGTGKTSLIKALATHYDRDLYILNLSQMSETSMVSALSQVPRNAVVAIEDIDACGVDLNRQEIEPVTGNNVNKKSVEKPGIFGISVGGILNAIDGVLSSEDRLVVAITNHPEKLDAALLREGRFGFRLKLDYIDEVTLFEYLNRFFPDLKRPVGFVMRKNVPPCDIQRLVLDNRNEPDNIVKALAAGGI